jgi:hypothetical protein
VADRVSSQEGPDRGSPSIDLKGSAAAGNIRRQTNEREGVAIQLPHVADEVVIDHFASLGVFRPQERGLVRYRYRLFCLA